MIAVVCAKWGKPFPAEYVNVLYHGVKKNMTKPFKMVCFTDDPTGLHPDIVVKQIPDIGLPPERWKSGCWPKMTIFKPGILSEFDMAMYLDLDIVIQGNLDCFFDRQKEKGGMNILREWNPVLWSLVPVSMRPDRGCQGSVFAWVPGEQDYLFDLLANNMEEAFKSANDQVFLTDRVIKRQYWPDEWCVSFKRTCLHYYPFNLIFKKVQQPRKAKIVVFHGNPRPVDLIKDGNERWGSKTKYGFGPVSWVKEYWLAGAKAQ